MSKFERVLRIVFLTLMFAVSWLNASGTEAYEPLWNVILVVGAMALTGWRPFSLFPFLTALPTLFLFNVWLLLRPSRTVRILYRVLMALLLPFKCYHGIEWRVLGFSYSPFLAEVVVLSIGALFEVIIVLVTLFKGRIHQQAGR